MGDVCPMSDLPVESCSHCRLGGPIVRDREPASRPFVADFPGECAGCGFSIEPGDTVRFALGGRLYHADHRRCTDQGVR